MKGKRAVYFTWAGLRVVPLENPRLIRLKEKYRRSRPGGPSGTNTTNTPPHEEITP